MIMAHLHLGTGRSWCSLLSTAALLVFISSLSQQAAAQEFSGIRNMQILKQVPINASVAATEWDSLVQKLPVLQNPNSQALLQLKMLSPRSRGKLDRSLDDTALGWLKNQTDAKLADLLESIRATNFRRSMAISYIYNSLPRAMQGNGVIFALQRLQVEDLERFASMPLWEPKYQNLTNVTLTDLANEIYNFGQTQVKQRTCILTQANTTAVTPLPLSQVTSTLARRHRRALTSNPTGDTSVLQEYAAQQQQQQHLDLVEEGMQYQALLSATQDTWRLREEGAHLVDLPVKQLGNHHQESESTFFRPFRRHLQQDAATGGQVSQDTTVGGLVVRYLNGLPVTTTATTGTASGDTSSYPAATPDDVSSGTTAGDYGGTDEAGFADDLSAVQFELPTSTAQEPSEVPLVQTPAADNSTLADNATDPLLCSVNGNGTWTFVNGTECSPPRPKPCAQYENGTRINETACALARAPCRRRVNGTLLNATRCELAVQSASGLECINGTRNGTFPPLPCDSILSCVNGTLEGTLLPCNGTNPANPANTANVTTASIVTNGTSNGTSTPCVDGFLEGTATPCNASAVTSGNSTGNSTIDGALGCVQGYLAGTTVPCNSTSGDTTAVNGTVACVGGLLQGTTTPCNATGLVNVGAINSTVALNNITEAAVAGDVTNNATGPQATLCYENGTFLPCPPSSTVTPTNQTTPPTPQTSPSPDSSIQPLAGQNNVTTPNVTPGQVPSGTLPVQPEATVAVSPGPDSQAGSGALNTASPSAGASPDPSEVAVGSASPAPVITAPGEISGVLPGQAVTVVPSPAPGAAATAAVPSPEPTSSSSSITSPTPGSTEPGSLTVPGGPESPTPLAAVPVSPTDIVTPTVTPGSSSSSTGPSPAPAEVPATPQTARDQPNPASDTASNILASPAPGDSTTAATANQLVQPTSTRAGTQPVTESNTVTPVTPVQEAVPPPAAPNAEAVTAPVPVPTPETTSAPQPPAVIAPVPAPPTPAVAAPVPAPEPPAVTAPVPVPPPAVTAPVPVPPPEPPAAAATTAPVPAPQPATVPEPTPPPTPTPETPATPPPPPKELTAVPATPPPAESNPPPAAAPVPATPATPAVPEPAAAPATPKDAPTPAPTPIPVTAAAASPAP